MTDTFRRIWKEAVFVWRNSGKIRKTAVGRNDVSIEIRT
jgi:hypothetical protein